MYVTGARKNIVDSNNSTTTPLSGGATFTGTGTDVSGYASVAITLYADVDSAASGMQFQFSTDNSNWDDSHDFMMDVSESDTRRFQFPVTAQYFRVVYTNGAGAQAAFRVQTILHTDNILTSIHRVGNTITTDRSAQLVKAVISGETTAGGGGTMVNAKVNPSGTLEVNATLNDMAGGATHTYGSASITTSATQILAANADRKGYWIQNAEAQGGSVLAVGDDGSITLTNCPVIDPRGSVQDSGIGVYTGAIYAISDASASSNNVRYWEWEE
jgi:hypothetical protein